MAVESPRARLLGDATSNLLELSLTQPGGPVSPAEKSGPVNFGSHPTLATTETPVVTAGSRPDDRQPPTRETLLVVDDEEMVRRLAARMLFMLGYRVLEARDGHEAVRLLQRAAHRVSGVLTDLAMPGIGGRGLGETIARCWPEVRVLYMSGFPAQRMVNEGALDPNHPFIQKPFTSEQLGRKVRELLAHPLEQ